MISTETINILCIKINHQYKCYYDTKYWKINCCDNDCYKCPIKRMRSTTFNIIAIFYNVISRGDDDDID